MDLFINVHIKQYTQLLLNQFPHWVRILIWIWTFNEKVNKEHYQLPTRNDFNMVREPISQTHPIAKIWSTKSSSLTPVRETERYKEWQRGRYRKRERVCSIYVCVGGGIGDWTPFNMLIRVPCSPGMSTTLSSVIHLVVWLYEAGFRTWGLLVLISHLRMVSFETDHISVR